MSATEAVLRVSLLQVQFELARAMADAVSAIDRVASAEQATAHACERRDAVTGHIRQIASRSNIDPELLGTSGRIHRAASNDLRRLQVQLDAARAEQTHALDVLSELRGRERTFESAMRLQRRQRQQMKQLASQILADELWLQRPRVEAS